MKLFKNFMVGYFVSYGLIKAGIMKKIGLAMLGIMLLILGILMIDFLKFFITS